jgi:hypothetical protein
MKLTHTTTQEITLSITDIVNAIDGASAEEKALAFDTLVKVFPNQLFNAFDLNASEVAPALISCFRANEGLREQVYADLDAESLQGIAEINGCGLDLLNRMKDTFDEGELSNDDVSEHFAEMSRTEAAELLIEIAENKGIEDKVAAELINDDAVSEYLMACDNDSFRNIVAGR